MKYVHFYHKIRTEMHKFVIGKTVTAPTLSPKVGTVGFTSERHMQHRKVIGKYIIIIIMYITFLDPAKVYKSQVRRIN